MKKKGKGDFMTALAVGYPMKAYKCPNDEKQIQELFLKVNNMQDWCVSLVEQVRFVLNNLDASNVSEAASVKAENIDTRFAKIKSAQIQSLKADKIKTGTLHVTEEMTIQNNDGSIKFLPNSIVMSTPKLDENGNVCKDEEGNIILVPRLQMGKEEDTNKFIFIISDKDGNDTLTLNDNGEGIFKGIISTYKDALVGHNLTLGGQQESESSISFSGMMNSSKITNSETDKVFTISPSYSKDDLIFTEMGTYLGRNRILTQLDYDELEKRIKDLEKKLP